jgi:hypothetical protein
VADLMGTCCQAGERGEKLKLGKQKAENGKGEARSQRAAVRGQGSEVRGQKPEDGGGFTWILCPKGGFLLCPYTDDYGPNMHPFMNPIAKDQQRWSLRWSEAAAGSRLRFWLTLTLQVAAFAFAAWLYEWRTALPFAFFGLIMPLYYLMALRGLLHELHKQAPR